MEILDWCSNQSVLEGCVHPKYYHPAAHSVNFAAQPERVFSKVTKTVYVSALQTTMTEDRLQVCVMP